jgi:hypothetical protein
MALLRKAAKSAFPEARIVALAPKRGQGGQGLAITPLGPEELAVEQIEQDFYVCDGTPADLIYLGLGLPQLYLGRGQFDLVLTGVNHGHNVGMDVFHSGTVGMAMLATTFFGVTAMAFSQQIEYGTSGLSDEAAFRIAAQYLPLFLENITQLQHGRELKPLLPTGGSISKNIVICSDGTGNSAKGRGTNVFKVFEGIGLNGHKTQPELMPQVALYDDGVGTENFKPLKIFAGATGFGLSRNVKQLYKELVRVYDHDNRIFLFGFSRGALSCRFNELVEFKKFFNPVVNAQPVSNFSGQ